MIDRGALTPYDTTQQAYINAAIEDYNIAHDRRNDVNITGHMLAACFWVLLALYMQKEDEVLPGGADGDA